MMVNGELGDLASSPAEGPKWLLCSKTPWHRVLYVLIWQVHTDKLRPIWSEFARFWTLIRRPRDVRDQQREGSYSTNSVKSRRFWQLSLSPQIQ